MHISALQSDIIHDNISFAACWDDEKSLSQPRNDVGRFGPVINKQTRPFSCSCLSRSITHWLSYLLVITFAEMR